MSYATVHNITSDTSNQMFNTITTNAATTSNNNTTESYKQQHLNAATAYNMIQAMLSTNMNNTTNMNNINSIGDLFTFINPSNKIVYDVQTGLIQTQNHHSTDIINISMNKGNDDNTSSKRQKISKHCATTSDSSSLSTATSQYNHPTVSIHSDSCDSNICIIESTTAADECMTNQSSNSSSDNEMNNKSIQLYTSKSIINHHSTQVFYSDKYHANICSHPYNTGFHAYNNIPHRHTNTTTTHNNPSLLRHMTMNLYETYHKCNPSYVWSSQNQPRRILTDPSQRVNNNGYDNCNHNLIVSVGDILYNDNIRHNNESIQQYRVIESLGQGTFGEVVKCIDCHTNQYVAVKIVKNKYAYTQQAISEIKILTILNQLYNHHHNNTILQLYNYFVYKSHVCIVFELMSINLYELIKQNNFRGISLSLIRTFTIQLCHTLIQLKSNGIVHADLKPENILLCQLDSPYIKCIDYGSACIHQQPIYSYIQSRFYRAPEVLLGIDSYGCEIDIWSLGCIICELYLGLPIFPGTSQYNQLDRIISIIGPPSNTLLDKSKFAHKYFDHVIDEHGNKQYTLKSIQQYAIQNNTAPTANKIYFKGTTLNEIISLYPIKSNISSDQLQHELYERQCLLHFITGCLQWDANQRFTPIQLLNHPFVTKKLLHTYDWHTFNSLKYHISNTVNPLSCLTDNNHIMWHNNSVFDMVQSRSNTTTTKTNPMIVNNMLPTTNTLPSNNLLLSSTLPMLSVQRNATMPTNNTFISTYTAANNLLPSPSMNRRRTANDAFNTTNIQSTINTLIDTNQLTQQLNSLHTRHASTNSSMPSPMYQSQYLQQHRLPISRAAVLQQLTPLNSPHMQYTTPQQQYITVNNQNIPSAMQLTPVAQQQPSSQHLSPIYSYNQMNPVYNNTMYVPTQSTIYQSMHNQQLQQQHNIDEPNRPILQSSSSTDTEVSNTSSRQLNDSLDRLSFHSSANTTATRQYTLTNSNCTSPSSKHLPPISPNSKLNKQRYRTNEYTTKFSSTDPLHSTVPLLNISVSPLTLKQSCDE